MPGSSVGTGRVARFPLNDVVLRREGGSAKRWRFAGLLRPIFFLNCLFLSFPFFLKAESSPLPLLFSSFRLGLWNPSSSPSPPLKPLWPVAEVTRKGTFNPYFLDFEEPNSLNLSAEGRGPRLPLEPASTTERNLRERDHVPIHVSPSLLFYFTIDWY